MIGYRLVITEDPWPAAPLLLTCRYVCEIGLEALYREINTPQKPVDAPQVDEATPLQMLPLHEDTRCTTSDRLANIHRPSPTFDT
jgi:hypothetical protein